MDFADWVCVFVLGCCVASVFIIAASLGLM